LKSTTGSYTFNDIWTVVETSTWTDTTNHTIGGTLSSKGSVTVPAVGATTEVSLEVRASYSRAFTTGKSESLTKTVRAEIPFVVPACSILTGSAGVR